MMTFLRLSALLGLIALAACETTEGFGRDVQSAGRALERESNEAQARSRANSQHSAAPEMEPDM